LAGGLGQLGKTAFPGQIAVSAWQRLRVQKPILLSKEREGVSDAFIPEKEG